MCVCVFAVRCDRGCKLYTSIYSGNSIRSELSDVLNERNKKTHKFKLNCVQLLPDFDR